MLTPQLLASYHRDGFAACPGFFTPGEVALMQAEVAQLRTTGQLRNVATAGDGATVSQTAFNLQICPLSPRSAVFRALPFAAKVTAQITAILASDFYLRLDQIFLKPANLGAGTNWHQDNAYFRDGADHLSARGVGMWIAIHDADPLSGTMELIPRAFSRTAPHARDPGSDHHITMAADDALAVPIVLPAGGALFFNWGVPHRTTGNRSARDRAGLALHFQDLALRPAELAGSTPILRGAAADGGAALHGSDQRGAWEALVPTAMAAQGDAVSAGARR